jgi:hypothetical protein
MNKNGIVLIGVLFLAYNVGLLRFAWLRQWRGLIAIGSRINHQPGDHRSSRTDTLPKT